MGDGCSSRWYKIRYAQRDDHDDDDDDEDDRSTKVIIICIFVHCLVYNVMLVVRDSIQLCCRYLKSK